MAFVLFLPDLLDLWLEEVFFCQLGSSQPHVPHEVPALRGTQATLWL